MLSGHADLVVPIEFTSDGERLVSGSFDHAIRVWDLAARSDRLLAGHDGEILGLELSDDGTTLVSHESMRVRRWDLATASSGTLAAMPNGIAVAGLLADGSIVLIDNGGYQTGLMPSMRIVADDVPRDHAAFVAWLARATTTELSPR